MQITGPKKGDCKGCDLCSKSKKGVIAQYSEMNATLAKNNEEQRQQIRALIAQRDQTQEQLTKTEGYLRDIGLWAEFKENLKPKALTSKTESKVPTSKGQRVSGIEVQGLIAELLQTHAGVPKQEAWDQAYHINGDMMNAGRFYLNEIAATTVDLNSSLKRGVSVEGMRDSLEVAVRGEGLNARRADCSLRLLNALFPVTDMQTNVEREAVPA